MKKLITLAALSLLVLTNVLSQEPLLDYMNQELKRNFEAFKTQNTAPYFMAYRVNDSKKFTISASFGALNKNDYNRERQLTIDVRVGDYQLDNSHELRDNWSDSYFSSTKMLLPVEDNEMAVKQALWLNTDKEYKKSVDRYNKVKANVAVKVENEDKTADFTKTNAEVFYENAIELDKIKFNQTEWSNIARDLSKEFLNEPSIISSNVYFYFEVRRKYFTSTENASIAHNETACRISFSARVKADDGMVMPLHRDFYAYLPEGLPSKEVMFAEVKDMVSILSQLKDAPVVEPYQGPALMSAEASGVFFHEIFGHRVEGQRMKSEYSGQTFKKKVGELVLPEELSVYFDPTISRYAGEDLNGSYKFDDQGVKGQKVMVVDKGILKGFLMSRTPIEGIPQSNGHGRAEPGKQVTTRQSNLIVESSAKLTKEDMKKMLLKELKEQGMPFGYYFSEVTGGFTTTGRFMPNSFNVTPTVVYKVYADGRPDELVRGVDLVGTPLAMFSEIKAAGGEAGIFTGTCGAESGGVPVTGISPILYVKKIEMQKKNKSQTKPAILERPDAANKKS